MKIRLIESEEIFSKENIKELEGFLSKLPFSHLKCLKRIERVTSLGETFANSSPWGGGEEIKLTKNFYDLTSKEREYVFLHEMGHNYFDFRDENEGNRSGLWGVLEKKDVSHLLRVKWMDLGLWELDPKNWEKVKAAYAGNGAMRDKYNYIVKFKDPCKGAGEWKCPKEARIPKNSFPYAFRYGGRGYSPKEEMADAYMLFALEKEYFKKSAERNKIIKDKYEFIKRHFSDDSKVKFTKK